MQSTRDIAVENWALPGEPFRLVAVASDAADWLSRLAEVTGVDRERTGHILDLRDAADRRLLDAITERWRDTVLAAPDQPRSPRWRFSRRRREPPRRWSGW